MRSEITLFINDLRKDYTFRKQEVMVLQQSWQNSANDIYNKCIILMLYAHFEGFIITSCNRLIKYIVNAYHPDFYNIPNIYKHLLLAQQIPDNITHFNKKVNTVREILESLTQLDKITLDPIKKLTKSNIGYDNFWEIITILGLSQDFLIAIKNSNIHNLEDDLNSLRDTRNNISHSGHGTYSEDSVTGLYQSTFSILEVLIDTIEQYLLSIKITI